MRILVRVVSLLGAVLCLGLALLVLSIGSLSDGAGNSRESELVGLVMLCPLVYFAVCFWTSFARRREMWVLVAGLLAHLCLTVFVVATFYAGDVGGICLEVAVVCMGLWIGMYLSLDKLTAT